MTRTDRVTPTQAGAQTKYAWIPASAGMTALLVAHAAHAQPVRKEAAPLDSAARAVAPGLALRHLARPEGPWTLHVLRVDLRAPGVAVEGVHALDAVAGRERTSDAARRWCAPGRRAVAAVNGDLFELATGAS